MDTEDAKKNKRQREREYRIANGLCVKCGTRPVIPGIIRCEHCASVNSAQAARRNQRRGDQGICVYCGKRPATTGLRTCAECREQQREAKKRRKAFDPLAGYTGIQLSPAKAMRARCLVCKHGRARAARNCPDTACPLYPFRMGTNPYRKLNLPEEERRERAKRLQGKRDAEIPGGIGQDIQN